MAAPDPDPGPLPLLTLVLGGQRSGKSAYAEGLIGDVAAIYLATGEALDGEMADRIARHQDRRGANWTAVEEPVDLVAALGRLASGPTPVLLDSLGMWVANLLGGKKNVAGETSALINTLKILTCPVVIVSDEAGLGIIPDNALARAYLDAMGTANQALAAAADSVILVVAGLPQKLK